MGLVYFNGEPYAGGGIIEHEYIYTTTERAVGTWIDGSTVYQKTFYVHSFSLASDAKYTIESSFSGNNVISYGGHDISNQTIYALPDGRLCVMIENGDLKIASINGGTWSGDLYLTVQYTKAST